MVNKSYSKLLVQMLQVKLRNLRVKSGKNQLQRWKRRRFIIHLLTDKRMKEVITLSLRLILKRELLRNR